MIIVELVEWSELLAQSNQLDELELELGHMVARSGVVEPVVWSEACGTRSWSR